MGPGGALGGQRSWRLLALRPSCQPGRGGTVLAPPRGVCRFEALTSLAIMLRSTPRASFERVRRVIATPGNAVVVAILMVSAGRLLLEPQRRLRSTTATTAPPVAGLVATVAL
jgi:hypothetical protein